MSFLDETGLGYFWSKIKKRFLPITGGTISGDLNVNGDTQFTGYMDTLGFSVDEHGNFNGKANTDVKQLFVKGIQVLDFVVAQGSSGVWSYRKYNSGIAECWGILTGVYHATFVASEVYALPFNFTSVNVITAGLADYNNSNAGTWDWNTRVYQEGTGIRACVYSAGGGIGKDTQVHIMVHVIGRWK